MWKCLFFAKCVRKSKNSVHVWLYAGVFYDQMCQSAVPEVSTGYVCECCETQSTLVFRLLVGTGENCDKEEAGVWL
jgi:hypothetical protein